MLTKTTSIFAIVTAFIRRDFTIEKSYKFSFLTRILDGTLRVVIFYFISRFLSADYFSFVFVGLVFSRTLQFFLSVFTDFLRQEQHWKTIEHIFLAPYDDFSIFLAANSGKFFLFFVEFVLYVAFGNIFLYKLKFSEFAVFLIAAFFTFVFVSSLGIISAAFVLKLKKGDPVNWLFSGVVDVLSGVYFPVEYLPGFLKNLSSLLPTTVILNLWRNILIEKNHPPLKGWLQLAGLSVILIFVAVRIFKKCWAAAKKRGDVGYY